MLQLPVSWSGNENWKDITVDHQYWGMSSLTRGFRTPKCNWCNADSLFIVTRTSALSENRYTDYACESCAKEWLPKTE